MEFDVKNLLEKSFDNVGSNQTTNSSVKRNPKFEGIVSYLKKFREDEINFNSCIDQNIYNTSKELIVYIVEEKIGILKKTYRELTDEEIRTIFLGALGEYKSKFNRQDIFDSMCEMVENDCDPVKGIQEKNVSKANITKTIEDRAKDLELELKEISGVAGPSMSDVSR